MTCAVFMITVTGEMDEALRDQFDDVEVTVGHGGAGYGAGGEHGSAARRPAPARRAGSGVPRGSDRIEDGGEVA